MIYKLEKFFEEARSKKQDVAAYDVSVKLSDGVVIADVIDVRIHGDDVSITSCDGVTGFVLYTITENVVRWWRTKEAS